MLRYCFFTAEPIIPAEPSAEEDGARRTRTRWPRVRTVSQPTVPTEMRDSAKRPAEQAEGEDERSNKTITLTHDPADSYHTHNTPPEDSDVSMSNFEQFLRGTSEEELAEFAQLLKHYGVISLNAIVSEVYSPPRVIAMCTRFGLTPGYALDLTTVDPSDSKPWDFIIPEKREKTKNMLNEQKPILLAGSPLCTAFSKLQNLNFSKMSKEEVTKIMAQARTHLHFCVDLYRQQIHNGRYFLHEHPDGATSWSDWYIRKLLNMREYSELVAICIRMR